MFSKNLVLRFIVRYVIEELKPKVYFFSDTITFYIW